MRRPIPKPINIRYLKHLQLSADNVLRVSKIRRIRMGRKTALVLLAALFIAQGAQTARANTIIDLTTAGAQSTQAAAIGGTFLVQQIQPQSTGTGFIDSFLRIQQDGSERGYNTNIGTPLDDKGGSFTHALLLSDVGVTNIGGTNFYHFVLDINQNGDGLLSLNQIQIFRAATDTLHTGLIEGSLGSASLISFAGATEVFRMNNTANPSAYEIQMDYTLNSGSGSGDMNLFVNKAFVDAAGGGNYLILYSQFGSPSGAYASNAGFEEWWNLRSTPTTPVPEPSAAQLLATGLLGLGLVASRRFCRN
jgi:hypothetical protein